MSASYFRAEALPPEVERILAPEVARGEVTVTRIRLGLSAAGILALLPQWSSNPPEIMWTTLGIGAGYAVWSGAALAVYSSGRHPAALRYVNVAVDMAVVTGAAAATVAGPSGAYEALLAPIYPMLYLIWIGLTGLQYSSSVSLWAAGCAAFARLALLVGLVSAGIAETTDEVVYGVKAVNLAEQGTGVFFLLVFGAVMAWFAELNRRLLVASARETLRAQRLQSESDRFRRYMSAEVLDYVLQNPAAMGLGGVRRTATVLFLDIRNFTAFAERSAPERVVEFLNVCFTEFVEVVFRNGGTLDKFLGDGLMAVYGVPREMPDAPERAVRTAIEIVDRVRSLNEGLLGADAAELRIGVGIAHGEVVAGNIGSEQRMEFTVIGDTVNFAARLQELTKDLACTVIVSDSVHEHVRHVAGFRRLPPVKVRGKRGEPVLWGLSLETRVSETLTAPEIVERPSA